MQLGFLLLEAGYVEDELINLIIIKNIMDISISFIGYSLFGYTLSSMNSHYGIIGF